MTNSSGTRRARWSRALIRSSHPGPCLAITAMTVLLAIGASALSLAGAGVVSVFTVAVLAGQLSIGWSNDAFDADLDAAAGRTAKPLVAGDISRSAVLIAAYVALAASFVMAFAISVPTGLFMIPVVGAGWAYNAGLKATPWSGLMYVLGFGPIPGLAASILPGHPSARPWSLAAASLLGLGAHFANVLPDLSTDRAAGVRGLPQQVAQVTGERGVRLIALVLLLVASVLIALAPGVTYRWPVLVGLGGSIALAAIAVRAKGRTPFLCALGIAGIDVVMFLLGGADLV